MKKKYIKPAIQVYEVRNQQLLAGSEFDFYNQSPEDKNSNMY